MPPDHLPDQSTASRALPRSLTMPQEGVAQHGVQGGRRRGLLLLDLKDLQALLAYVAEQRQRVTRGDGDVSQGDNQNGAAPAPRPRAAGRRHFFGDPALDIEQISCAPTRRQPQHDDLVGPRSLMQSPHVYATFLLGLLRSSSGLPDIGDPEKPKLVFFFDEALLLFNEAPEAAPREDRAGRPPDPLEGRRHLFHSRRTRWSARDRLAPVGNRVQHALRAFTPRDTEGGQAAATPLARSRLLLVRGDHRVRRRRGARLHAEDEGVPSMVSGR